jgi:hypothetical protein
MARRVKEDEVAKFAGFAAPDLLAEELFLSGSEFLRFSLFAAVCMFVMHDLPKKEKAGLISACP